MFFWCSSGVCSLFFLMNMHEFPKTDYSVYQLLPHSASADSPLALKLFSFTLVDILPSWFIAKGAFYAIQSFLWFFWNWWEETLPIFQTDKREGKGQLRLGALTGHGGHSGRPWGDPLALFKVSISIILFFLLFYYFNSTLIFLLTINGLHIPSCYTCEFM